MHAQRAFVAHVHGNVDGLFVTRQHAGKGERLIGGCGALGKHDVERPRFG